MIGLLSASVEKETTIKFLENSIPESIKGLFLSGDTLPPRPSLSEYLPYLLLNKHKLKKELWIRLFSVTRDDIKALFESFPHLEVIGFHDCTFPDLSDSIMLDSSITYSTKMVSFEVSADNTMSPLRFKHIANMIKNTTLNTSLQKINISECGSQADIAYGRYEELMHGIDHIGLYVDQFWYFYELH